MQEFQARVIDEKEQLDIKIHKLNLFINENAIFDNLPGIEQDRLNRQLEVMQEYSYILELRIKDFKQE